MAKDLSSRSLLLHLFLPRVAIHLTSIEPRLCSGRPASSTETCSFSGMRQCTHVVGTFGPVREDQERFQRASEVTSPALQAACKGKR